ncbi:MAG TPA: protein kinase [Thermoanaerobaculia bacterium]|nr:protein kinase [Thermoanaerobaculia bacterium]
MTVAAHDTGETAVIALQKKPYTVEKARVPLVLKLFGLTALLIVIVVGLAVGITIERANQIARDTIDRSIASAAKLFKDFERQRIDRLVLSARTLGSDPTFVAYMQNNLTGGGAKKGQGTEPTSAAQAATAAAAPSADATAPGNSPVIDYASIIDLLVQKKELIKTDLLIFLDDQGRLVARTDQPTISGGKMEDLYEEVPLVKKIVDDAGIDSVSGVIEIDNRLFHVAIAPLVLGANNVRVAYVINAYAIDETFADRIADSTNAGVMFFPAARPGVSSRVSRSKNAPSVGMQQMSGVEEIFRTGKMIPPSTAQIEKSAYVMTGEPLLSGTKPVGAAVFVRSLDRELEPFRRIENSLLLGGAIALLLAFVLSWLIAKRVTHPIEELAVMAQAVTAGDYTVHPRVDRLDEVGILGRSFAKMITALRDKSEIEELYEQMAAKSQEREAVRAIQAPKLEDGTVLVSDLRGLPATVGEGDAASVIASVSRVMKLQEAEVIRQDGYVREIDGHRLVSVFRGDRGIIHAIRAARAINEEMALQSDPKAPMAIGVGIATGEFVSGSVDLSQESGLAVIGNAPLLASIFAWHAPTGYAYVSYETAQAAGAEIASLTTREEVRLRWLAQPLPVASIPLMSLTTGVMGAYGTAAGMATVRVGATVAGLTAPSSRPVDLESGHLFANRYRIEQIVGRGGMGVVYKALDTQLDETVAIKTLPGDVMSRSPEDLERFKREIRLARKITHRNVLRTYDYGEADGVYFISMEYVRGYTLADLLEEARQMAPRVATGITRQICRGLEEAHDQGIIHRDIKPQNVLIDHKGEVKLMDFGIARMTENVEAMTQAGLIVGTPHYMSPEQVRGNQLDPRSDVYSMGVMLYEILVGEKPFTSTSLTGVLSAHLTDKPRPPIELRPEVGRDLNAIVLRCLEKDPKDRYEDAGEMLHALDSVQISAVAA